MKYRRMRSSKTTDLAATNAPYQKQYHLEKQSTLDIEIQSSDVETNANSRKVQAKQCSLGDFSFLVYVKD